MKRTAILAVGAGLLVAASRVAAAGPPYNLLLISLDSVRADALGCYGYASALAPGVSPSPTLDRLAADGVRMQQAYATSPWTLPSHVSLMTGEPTMVHLVENDLQRLSSSRPVLAELLRDRGWRTAGVFSGPYLEPLWGFGRGFERYEPAYDRAGGHLARKVDALTEGVEAARRVRDRRHADLLNWKRRLVYLKVREYSHAEVTSDQVTRAVLDRIDEFAPGTKPWFVFAHYFDPHYDYIPPPPWDTRYDPDYRGSMTGHGFFTNPAVGIPDPADPDRRLRRVSDRDLAHLQALYVGELAWVDQHLAQLFDRLATLGVADRTLVVVVSDHGDEFFEHGSIGHRQTVFDEVVRIPMLMRLPGVLPRGRVVDQPVSLADVLPTVLELQALPVPEVGGTSMLPAIRGEAGTPAGILARLVRVRPTTLTIDGTKQVAGREVIVEETFRTGSLKVFRRRRWPIGPPGLPSSVARAVYALGDREYRREELAWVDVARAPAEPRGAFSDRFDAPPAHEALEGFQAYYRHTSARTHVRFEPLNEFASALYHRLAGLGYVETAGEPAVEAVRAFVLPPPGDHETALAKD